MNEPANRGATPSRRMLALVVALTALATIAIAALLVNIFERKQEAKNPFYRVVDLNDAIDDPAIWGKDFPMQYDLYLRTTDMQRTKYGGGEAVAPPAHPDRPPIGGGALQTRAGSASQNHLGGIRLLRRLSRAPRPCLHAR